MDRAAAFLADGGRNIVRGYLHTFGLPTDLLDDVVQEVFVNLHRMDLRGEEIDDERFEATVATIARRRSIDLLRGRLRRPEGHLVGVSPDGTDPLDELVASDRPEDTALAVTEAGSMVEDLRRGLQARLSQHPWRAAGGLVVLGIVHGDARPAVDCPAPKAGVAQDEAVAWAGLFYGGAEGCFPSDEHREDAAMRKRRSRALAHQQTLLREVATDVGAILEDDDG